MDKDGCVFTFASGKQLKFAYASGSNLPIANATKNQEIPSAFMSLVSSDRLNISKGQEELLLWYSISGHYDIRNVQQLIGKEVVKTKHSGVVTCDIPICRSCLSVGLLRNI